VKDGIDLDAIRAAVTIAALFLPRSGGFRQAGIIAAGALYVLFSESFWRTVSELFGVVSALHCNASQTEAAMNGQRVPAASQVNSIRLGVSHG
jgi:hypothetical protein